MAYLKTHRISSQDELETQSIAAAAFRPSEFWRLKEAGAFDIEANITSVRNITVWQISTSSGYRARYGCPKHHQVELHFIEGGTFCFQSADEEIEASARSAVLLKDTRKVTITASPGSRKLSVVIPFELVAPHFNRSHASAGRGLATLQSHIETATDIDIIYRIAAHLLYGLDPNGLEPDTAGTSALIRDALIMMFVSLWPKEEIRSDERPTFPRHLERAIDWLERHADQDISIEQLARQSGASIRTLQNSFRHHLSATPNAYILQMRLSRVHNELLTGSGDESIEKIASRWGFGHMGYFAARYRAQYGQAPSDTRKSRTDLK